MSLPYPVFSLGTRRNVRRTAVILVAATAGVSLGALALLGTGINRPSAPKKVVVYGAALWFSAVVAASIVTVLALVRHRRLLTLLMNIRQASELSDREQQIASVIRSVRTGVGARAVRLDLASSGEGVWTVGPTLDVDAPERIVLHRGSRQVGVLDVWWPTWPLRTFQLSLARRDDREEVLALVADTIAAELEIAGLAELLAIETEDHDRDRVRDSLTGLLNRPAFLQEVGSALANRLTASAHVGATGASRGLAVAVLDLNRFNEINATLGHGTGDKVLREVADRVVAAVPVGSVVARVGGDELGILVPDVDGVDGATAVMADVVDSLRRLVSVAGVDVLVDAAVGVAVAPVHGFDASILMRRAGAAMQAAKEKRTSAYEVWNPAQEQAGNRNLQLAGDLRRAIEVGHIDVHYQPKTDIADGSVIGVEALVRWHHPEFGWIAPDELVPLAERTGLISSLTTLVLRSALTAGSDWNRQGLELGVAVNISARSLLDVGLVDDVRASLSESGFPAPLLTLEITETELTVDAPVTMETLQQLRALGVRIAIDDFGTGYSALSYLARLDVDELKIDKSFVTDLGADPTKQAIVAAVVQVAASLGLTTVAEGVEDAEVLRHLGKIGCTAAQGFHLSKPMASASMAMWLWERRRVLTAPARDARYVLASVEHSAAAS
jgi:diguanylate cyclase (GGDEF)-like protein